MAMDKSTRKSGIIGSVKRILERCRKKYTTLKEGEIQINGGCVRVPCSGTVLEICLGGVTGKTLQLQPDLLPEEEEKESGDQDWPTYWVVDMERIPAGAGGFLRLKPKQNLILGRHAREQGEMFDYSTQVANRHLSILHHGEYLQLTDLGSEDGSCVRLLSEPKLCLSSWRRDQLKKIENLFFHDSLAKKEKEKDKEKRSDHGITQPLPGPAAMKRLLRAHKVLRTAFAPTPACTTAMPSSLLEEEGYDGEDGKEKRGGEEEKREKGAAKDKESTPLPPALVHLTADTIPVLVGDLHAKVSNLLTLLATGGVLAALESGTVTLVILGDAVHPDEAGNLTDMGGSMLIMDLILTLMIRFPGRVVYLRGNHDGFSADIYKGKVCQGQVWSQALSQTRGKAYRNAMRAFYRDLPYVVVHPRLLAAHAAPPVVKITRKMLTDLRDNNQLVHQLTWNRMYEPTRPGGYREKDVKNFRQAFDLPKETAFIVGHTPMDHENTAWLHAGGMEHHHVLYSGSTKKTGWIVCLPGGVIHLECPVMHQPGIVPGLPLKPGQPVESMG